MILLPFWTMDDDLLFFGSDIEWSDDSPDDKPAEVDTAEALECDAEENVDDAAPAQVDQPLAGSGPSKRKRKGQAATVSTLEDVVARVEKGCGCQGANCFTNIAPDDILRVRNLLGSVLGATQRKFVLLAGKAGNSSETW
eukprot:scpid94798/ scgid15533/ 